MLFESINILGVMVLILQLGIIFFLLSFFFWKKPKHYLKNYGMLIIFIISIVSTLGSLFFSEIADLDPCKLCWYQRIMMYPIVLLSGISLFKKDNNVFNYIIPLSAIGLIIAGYHYIIQITTILPEFCLPGQTSCAESPFFFLGFISIPLMAFTAFLGILIASLVRK